MLADLCRPKQLSYAGSDIKIPSAENNHFTVGIGGETIRCATGGPQTNANVAEKIEAFCGTVHVEQANSVMRGLSQAAHLALSPILAQYGISTRQSEHMALTYTLTKNDETGAVTSATPSRRASRSSSAGRPPSRSTALPRRPRSQSMHNTCT